MREIDHLELHPRTLALLLAVYEEKSVTRGAKRLGLSQSAASHALDRLRELLGDPLFVRCGRVIQPTPRTDRIIPLVREHLAGLKALTMPPEVDLQTLEGSVTIAANDLQMVLILPTLCRQLAASAPGVTIRVIPSAMEAPLLLQEGRCDLAISPVTGNDPSLMRQWLFKDRFVVFYDRTQHEEPPATKEAFLKARHLRIRFPGGAGMGVDLMLEEQGWQRRIALEVNNFATVRYFVQDTAQVVILPGLAANSVMEGLDWCECPFTSPTLDFYALWHVRNHAAPLHHWLRRQLKSISLGIRPW
ncbi:MAG: LysR family transcriptional regulator [Magnetococcales bacterium]|nr:LysR family transcriptional regulator [Magnetococcales bacterium]